jgi:glycosyltransferase involved in cell wall biosynthesis
MKTFTVSIITIVKNDFTGIEKTINSCLNQSGINFEYIIIDCESNDGTSEIIVSHKNKISQYIRETDSGVYDAMNKGVQLSKGEWIIFMNSGDIFYDSKILNKIFCCDLNQFSMIVGQWIESDKIDKLFEPSLKAKFGMIACHQAILVRTQIMKRIKFNINYKIAGDFDFFTQILHLEKSTPFYFKQPVAIIDPNGIGRNKELYHKEYSKIILNYFGLISYLKYRLNHNLSKLKSLEFIKHS